MIQIDEHILEMVLVQPPTMLFYPNNLWKNEGFNPPIYKFLFTPKNFSERNRGFPRSNAERSGSSSLGSLSVEVWKSLGAELVG